MVLLVRVVATINPTEVPERVIKAITNIFPFDPASAEITPASRVVRLDIDPSVRYTVEGNEVVFKSSNPAVLALFHELLRKEYIVECGRAVLLRAKGAHGAGEVRFLLNKQVATRGKVHFAEPGESPLGPITVSIQSDDIDAMIDWLTPPTKDGVVMEVHDACPRS